MDYNRIARQVTCKLANQPSRDGATTDHPTLTADDWQEIYYALQSKLASPTTSPGEDVGPEWRDHLRRIIDTIGPDGAAMYPGA